MAGNLRYQFEAALPVFLKSIEANPGFGRGHEGVGAIYFGTGEEWRALSYLRAAAQYMPDQVRLRRLKLSGSGRLA